MNTDYYDAWWHLLSTSSPKVSTWVPPPPEISILKNKKIIQFKK